MSSLNREILAEKQETIDLLDAKYNTERAIKI
jgi:hypothetical protein